MNDFRHGEVLKNPAAHFLREQPNLGNDFRRVMDEALFARALAETLDQTVEIPLGVVHEPHFHGHGLPDDFIEVNFRADLGKEIEPELEELGDGLLSLEPGDEQHIFAERGSNREWSVRLCVFRHAVCSQPAKRREESGAALLRLHFFLKRRGRKVVLPSRGQRVYT